MTLAIDPHSPEGWLTILQEKPGATALGGAEIVCLGPHDPVATAAAWAAVFAQSQDPATGDRVSFQIVVPPHAPFESVETRFFEVLVPPTPDESPDETESRRDRARSVVPILVQDSFDGEALAVRIADAPSPTFTLVLDADAYETGPATPRPDDASPEDWLWADRLARFAEAVVSTALPEAGATYLISRRYAPTDRRSHDRLLEIDNVGVMIVEDSETGELRSRMADLMRRVALGDPRAELEAVDALGLDPINADHIRAQLLHAAGDYDAAYRLVRPYLDTLAQSPVPNVLVKLGRMAQRSGHTDHARVYLQRLLEVEPIEESPLAIGAELAESLGETGAQDALLQRLRRFYPQSVALMRDAFFRCERPADYAAFMALYQPLLQEARAVAEARLYLRIAETLATDDIPDDLSDLDRLFHDVEAIDPTFVSKAALPVSAAELTAGRPDRALVAALAWSPTHGASPERTQAHLLLLGVESLFARLPDLNALSQDIVDLLNDALFAAADFVRRHPTDSLRLVLSNLVSPDTSGPLGIAVFTTLVGSLTSKVEGEWLQPTMDSPIPDEDFLAIMKRLYADSAGRASVMIGHGPVPWTGGYDTRRILDHVHLLLQKTALQRADDHHHNYLIILLHLGLLLARDVGHPGEEADLVRIVGANLATLGRFQGARDLAEQVFLIPAPNPDDLIDAWLTHADLYHHVRRPAETLVALAVAATDTDRPWRPSTAYHFAILQARTFRDLGFPDLAIDAVSRARGIAEGAGLADAARNRLDLIEVGAEIQRLWFRAKVANPVEISERIDLLTTRLEGLLREDDSEPPLPVVTVLASLVRLAEQIGHESDHARKALRSAQSSLDGYARDLLDALATPPTTPEALATYIQGLGSTHHAQDASTDVRLVAEFARDALGAPDITPTVAVTFIEYLTDRSVRPLNPGRDDTKADHRDELQRRLARAVSAGVEDLDTLNALRDLQASTIFSSEDFIPDGPETNTNTLARLADAGIDVLAFAFAGHDEGHLVAISNPSGAPAVHRVDPNAFSPAAFARWRRVYPKGYEPHSQTAGYDLAAVERSLEGLALPIPTEGGPLVLIPETALQAIPPNLACSDRTSSVVSPLIGLHRPVAVVPSLSWLRSALTVGSAVAGERIAWIPASAEPGEDFFLSALELLRAGITSALDQHGFTIHTDVSPPDGVDRAALAVVGAHGGLHSAGRQFRALSDEDHLVLTPARVAGLVGGADVTILFVCHGGRIDAHPYAVATTGLARLLLDRGSRAVLASPWPLDPSVPKYWLPAFLTAWSDGCTIAEACFEANQTVARSYSRHPSDCLAMNLIGNPLLRLS